MAKKVQFAVIWDEQEKLKLKELITDIRKRSSNLADEIKIGIKERIDQVKLYPKSFEQDELKKNNDGSFRKFSVIHIRVVYKIEEKEKNYNYCTGESFGK